MRVSLNFTFQMKLVKVVAIFLTICYTYRAEDESNARLLASKNILNQYLVENRELTVEYKIFNVGGRYVCNLVQITLPKPMLFWIEVKMAHFQNSPVPKRPLPKRPNAKIAHTLNGPVPW